MITGAHAMIYSKEAEADRAFLRDVLGLGHVDVGGGWLIFALPPSEIAVHPGKKSAQEIYFMCDDVTAFKSALATKKITTSPVRDQGWGLLTTVTLPGGGELGVYEPRHARPEAASSGAGKSRAKPRVKQTAATKTVKASASNGRAKPAAPAAAKQVRGAVKPAAAKGGKQPSPGRKPAQRQSKQASRATR